MKKILLCLFALSATGSVWAQLTLIDGRAALNRPFFEPGKEISRILIEATQSGQIQPYSIAFDRLFQAGQAAPMARAEFAKGLTLTGNQPEEPADDADWGDEQVILGPVLWLPQDLCLLGLGQVAGNNYLSLFVPADLAAQGSEPDQAHYLASFRWDDCITLLANDSRAVWLPPALASFGDFVQLNGDSQAELATFLISAGQKGTIAARSPDQRLLTTEEFSVRLKRARQMASNPQLAVIVRERAVPDNNRLAFVPEELVLVAENTAEQGQLYEVAKFSFVDFCAVAQPKLWAKQANVLGFGAALQQQMYVPTGSSALLPVPTGPAPRSRLGQTQSADLILGQGCNQVLFRKRKELVRLLLDAQRTGKIRAYRRWFTPAGDSTRLLGRDEVVRALTDTLTGKLYGFQALNRIGWEERVVFDANGQHKTYNPTYLAIILPAELNNRTGIDQPVAWFDHDEVVTLLRSTGKAKFTDKTRKKNRRRNYADLLLERQIDLLVHDTGSMVGQ